MRKMLVRGLCLAVLGGGVAPLHAQAASQDRTQPRARPDARAWTDAEAGTDVRARPGARAGARFQAPTVTRYVRFERERWVAYGILEGDSVRELRGDLLASPQPTGRSFALADVELLAPIDPADVHKVLGVAINTMGAGREGPVPHPRFFAKFPTSIGGPGDPVELPPEAANLNYEGELVIVIGTEGRHIPEDEALDHVFGFTAGNDFSENTWYGERAGVEEPTRLVSKGTDSWAPIGPAIVTGLNFTDLAVEVRLNGEVVQRGRTSELANKVPNLISYISRYVTLEPGDLIFTGTVGRVEGARRAMQAGDELQVEIEGIGVLRNHIVPMEDEPAAEDGG